MEKINDIYENLTSIINKMIRVKNDLNDIDFYYKHITWLEYMVEDLRAIQLNVLHEKIKLEKGLE